MCLRSAHPLWYNHTHTHTSIPAIMSTLGQLTIRHEDLEDDACSQLSATSSTLAQIIDDRDQDLEDDASSTPTTWSRQYGVVHPMTDAEVRFQLNEAWLRYGLDLHRGMTISQVITELPWCANAAALSWQFRNNMDQTIDEYIF